MRLSLEKNFIFVHIPKTAGQSISNLLKPYSLPPKGNQFRRLTSYLPYPEKPNKLYLRAHDPAYWVRIKLGEDVFLKFFKFSFVRNLFDRLVSYYEFHRQTNHKHKKHVFHLNFSEYIEYQIRIRGSRFKDQTYFVADAKGNIIIDQIYKFENFSESIDILSNRLKISGEIKHLNKTSRKHYSEYYSKEDISKAKTLFARDLDNFSYTF